MRVELYLQWIGEGSDNGREENHEQTGAYRRAAEETHVDCVCCEGIDDIFLRLNNSPGISRETRMIEDFPKQLDHSATTHHNLTPPSFTSIIDPLKYCLGSVRSIIRIVEASDSSESRVQQQYQSTCAIQQFSLAGYGIFNARSEQLPCMIREWRQRSDRASSKMDWSG